MHILKFIVANNILRLRTDAEMSREELGEKIHYSEDYILKWERAEAMPDDDAIAALAQALGVDADYLLNPHDEWVSKEEKEYLENASALAPSVETKNLREKEEEPESEPESVPPPARRKKKSRGPFAALISLMLVGMLWIGAEEGMFGCSAQSIPESEINKDHVHEYGDWQIISSPTPYDSGEMQNQCYNCGEYIYHPLPASTPGLFYDDLGDGTCVVTGIGHGPENSPWDFSRIVIPPYITEIGDDGELISLQVVAIGDEFLGSFGERFLDGIYEVEIPDTVTSIGSYAFCNAGISTINMYDSITYIGDYAFAGCNSMGYIYLSENLEYIGEGAFQNCASLTEINMRNRVTEIKPYTFQNCYNLERIYLENMTVIGEYAFAGCQNLQGVNIFGEALERIEGYAFQACYNIHSVIFHSNVTYIGELAFDACKELEYVVFAENGKDITIDKGAFYGCVDIEELDLRRVTYIGQSAFNSCTSLVRAYIYAEEIHETAFGECEALGALWLGDKLTYIGVAAFRDCYSLSTVTIPASVKVIDEYAFYSCENLNSFTTRGSLEQLGSNAFAGCDKLTHLSLYDMNGIGETFRGNTILMDVAISNGEIPANAFRNCTSIYAISLFDGVTSIGDYAFAYITPESGSVGVIYSQNLKHIGEYAFAYTSLTFLTIGESVEYVGKFAFYETPIIELNIKSADTVFDGYAFANCIYLRIIEFPDDMKHIYDGMFSCCDIEIFTNLVLPDSITTIGAYAFQECYSIKEVTISNNITEIGMMAFYYCVNLEKIYYGGTMAEWYAVNKADDWRIGINKNIVIVCTDGEVIDRNPY